MSDTENGEGEREVNALGNGIFEVPYTEEEKRELYQWDQ